MQTVSNVVYLSDAQEDLFDVWRYVYEESRSLKIADSFVDKIDATCRVYATQPELGELRPDLARRVRCFPVSNHVVFYVPLTDGIKVIQIVHGARDIPAHFRRPLD